ncbi:MAG TPA: M56 family metallopeptidase [Thermoanaerobaculia bacterium]|jgi:beta-lactamase regulating signal transducer with metallopeptidase domain
MTLESLLPDPVLLSGRLLAASLELAVLAALVGIGARLGRLRSPRVLALLWLLVMVKPLVSLMAGPLVPALTLDVPLREAVRIEQEARLAPMAPMAGGAAEPASRHRGDQSEIVLPLPSPRRLAGGFAALWAAGVVALVLFGIWDRLRLRRIVVAARPASPALNARLAEVAARFGMTRAPRLLVTRDLESPALAGTLRPVVLLPAWLAEEGTPEQLDWALGHELMHWKLKDPLAGAARQVLQTLFFFHPMAWWVGRRWEEAAERACDRALVASREDAVCYAERLYEMLVKAGSRRRPALASGLFATRTQIGRRIAALLQEPLTGPSRLSASRRFALILLTALALSVGAGSLDLAAGTGSGNAELQLSDDHGRWRLEARGEWAFTADGTDVESLSPGSFLWIEQLKGGPEYRVEFRGLEDGTIERKAFLEGRRQEFDDGVRDWLARTLPKFVRVMVKHE